ncbi:alpha/beta hydrolase [Roseomonas frigidaquae]|uniref:Alpha/beta hydrolase n=1 Tax=Falsiroseomonas frigidaquae TaxID=487318 RepID=A0ABX1F4F6_9PROT|nr:alpha/beta hydrolase [Falsiroseomonas frigidaquae]NKE47213.1 alpha/beta hydrolase [Falsiroseomonas frigidaquae]
MLKRRGLIALGALAALPRAAQAQTVFHLPDPAGMRVFLHRPAGWRPDGRVIIVMHGLQRDADRYLAEWAPQAEAANLLVVAPEFSRALFPTVASYNWGNVVTQDLAPNPPEAWSFGIIEKVWDAVRARTGATRPGYALFGHSAGAQFVHRYLLLAETSRAEAIITANAGSYTMPVREVAFPSGLGGTSVDDARLAAAFARPVTVLLGADDVDPNHRSIPRQPGAIAQGPHRMARGLRFYAEARSSAWRLGVPFRWRLETVPGVGHDNGGMARRAAEIAVSAPT